MFTRILVFILSLHRELDVLIEPFPVPVEVTAPEAALRKEGDRSATVVADLTKARCLLPMPVQGAGKR